MIERKEKAYYLHFFAYVPVRDQNLVVRGKNYCLFGFVFFITFWKKVSNGKAK